MPEALEIDQFDCQLKPCCAVFVGLTNIAKKNPSFCYTYIHTYTYDHALIPHHHDVTSMWLFYLTLFLVQSGSWYVCMTFLPLVVK